jgi:histone H3/H4
MAKKSRDSFVVGSKVREFVKSKKCFASGDLLEGLNKQVASLLSNAVDRAKNNKRKTVRSHDV